MTMTPRCARCGKFSTRLHYKWQPGDDPANGPDHEVCDRCDPPPASVEVLTAIDGDRTILTVGPSKSYYGVPVVGDEDRNEDD